MSGKRAFDDPVTGAYLEAAAEGRLVCQRCADCGELRWPALPRCPECRGAHSSWVDMRPTGTIWSYTVYHRALSPRFKDQVPYAVAMIRLDDGPDMVGRLSLEEGQPSVGDRVEIERFDGDAVPTPVWRITPPTTTHPPKPRGA